MFGSDQYKNKNIEDILLSQNFTEASYSKNSKNWKEGKFLEKIFYQIAKDEGITMLEVKNIYFEGWAKVSQYMRHTDFPIIEVPFLGRFYPSSNILSKHISIGNKVWDKAKEGDPNIDPPFFLTKLIEAKRRRDIELSIRRPRYPFLTKTYLNEEDLMEIGRALFRFKRKKYLFVHYLCEFGGEVNLRVLDRLSKEFNVELDCEKRYKLIKTKKYYEDAKARKLNESEHLEGDE